MEKRSNTIELHNSGNLELLRSLPADSVDSIVTDPPYGLRFMGNKWDYDVPSAELWQECLRVLKPGGYLLSFAGSRTYHRMVVRIEDAGFEIRDMIAWIYGSGFPKSLNVSKQIDQQEKDRWVKISKAIDNLNFAELTELWINSKSANVAGVKFQRKATEAGLNTQKNGFAHGNVLLQANRKNCDALAVIAELSLIEVHHTSVETCSSAQLNAESSITESKSHATTVGKSPENREATRCLVDFSALQSAWGWQGESKADKLKAVEALKTWLGSKPSSRQGVTNALCAALTDDLKLITLSQSKTFLSFDTTRQTACASAINATITESTAGSLISFTVDTLRSKAIDKAAGAERDVVGVGKGRTGILSQPNKGSVFSDDAYQWPGNFSVTVPATEEAKQWDGWGTALKPAIEPIVMARKPLSEKTVAANVLKHGTGAINIDGCRIHSDDAKEGRVRHGGGIVGNGTSYELPDYKSPMPAGRWPANIMHDGSEEVESIFPYTKSGAMKREVGEYAGDSSTGFLRGRSGPSNQHGDEGSASRFFYCAKASKKDRGEGNNHPTVKPTDLMKYLCRLVTPPGGTVLDPFMGSGSTGKAAILEGFDFLGVEINPEYFAIAEERINGVRDGK